MTPRNIPMPDSLVEAVDRWRAQQPGIPNRSEAIRRLLEIALRSESATDGQ